MIDEWAVLTGSRFSGDGLKVDSIWRQGIMTGYLFLGLLEQETYSAIFLFSNYSR